MVGAERKTLGKCQVLKGIPSSAGLFPSPASQALQGAQGLEKFWHKRIEMLMMDSQAHWWQVQGLAWDRVRLEEGRAVKILQLTRT